MATRRSFMSRLAITFYRATL